MASRALVLHRDESSTTCIGQDEQEIQCALNEQQNDLLQAMFAMELLELVEPAVLRATHLRECVVATPRAEKGNR